MASRQAAQSQSYSRLANKVSEFHAESILPSSGRSLKSVSSEQMQRMLRSRLHYDWINPQVIVEYNHASSIDNLTTYSVMIDLLNIVTVYKSLGMVSLLLESQSSITFRLCS